MANTATTNYAQSEGDLDINFPGDQYDFKNFQYPSTLGEKTDPHYMVFYINVDSQSKFIDRAGTPLRTATFVEQNRIGSLSSSNSSSASGNDSYSNSAYTPDRVKTYFPYKDSQIEVNLSGMTDNAFLGQFTKTTKRISRAIVLPVPTSVNTNYGISWQSSDMGIAAGVLDAESKNQATEQYSGIGKVMSHVLARAGIAAGAAGATAGMRVIGNLATARYPWIGEGLNAIGKEFGADKMINTTGVVEKVTRSAINPRKEQLFKNVNFRTFSFNWVLVPKNPEESNNINNILQEFKFHMHPELAAGGIFYVYPSEFDIKFYFAGVENGWLSRISTCVLTDMKVSYTPNNQFNTYKDGSPDAISLQLSFTELELLTKERIEAGF